LIVAPPGTSDAVGVVERLNAAMNAHDIEAFVACFHPDYDSEQPAHPERAFRGRDQVRENWSAVFAGVPDFRSELVRASADGEVDRGSCAGPCEEGGDEGVARSALGQPAAHERAQHPPAVRRGELLPLLL